MKKISIIIATYNAEDTLRNCLDSIVCQLSHDVELIIIDGGSKDDTLRIINQYRIYISYTISEPDAGVYDAWNKGIINSSGEWIAFIGADDVLLPGALNIYLQCIDQTADVEKYDYICAHNEFVDTNGKILKIIGELPKWKVMRRKMAAAHVASLHNKKNLFDSIGLYDLNFKICADYELLLRKRDDLKAIFIPYHIARMRTGGISFSTHAIKETYDIRRYHKTVPSFINFLLYLRDYFLFKLFVLRNFILGSDLCFF